MYSYKVEIITFNGIKCTTKLSMHNCNMYKTTHNANDQFLADSNTRMFLINTQSRTLGECGRKLFVVFFSNWEQAI